MDEERKIRLCPDCGLILFDYTDNRAGMGRPVLDVLAEKVDGLFDAIDRKFTPKPQEEAPAADPESSEPEVTAAEEKPKKRIITSSGVRMVDEEETR